jgi:hypothetical protein
MFVNGHNDFRMIKLLKNSCYQSFLVLSVNELSCMLMSLLYLPKLIRIQFVHVFPQIIVHQKYLYVLI